VNTSVVWFFKTHPILCWSLDEGSGNVTFGSKFMKPLALPLALQSSKRKTLHLQLDISKKITPGFTSNLG
jgi:hypothetical protein